MPGLPWKSDLISEVFPGKIKVQILQFSFKFVFVYVIVGRIKELSQLCYSSHLQTLFFPFEAWWRKCYGWGYVLVSRRNLTKLLEEHQIDNLVLENKFKKENVSSELEIWGSLWSFLWFLFFQVYVVNHPQLIWPLVYFSLWFFRSSCQVICFVDLLVLL